MESNSNRILRYNSIIQAFVIMGDLCLCNGLFYAFYYWANMMDKPVSFNSSLPQILIVMSLCYLLCTMRGGVILHRQKVHSYQIVARVFRNVFYFTIVSGVLLTVGMHFNVISLFYAAYLSALFLIISIYRLMFRTCLKIYRNNKKTYTM